MQKDKDKDRKSQECRRLVSQPQDELERWLKNRKNCECCSGHNLIVNHWPPMSLLKFCNLSVIVICVTMSLIHKIARNLNLNLNRCLCSHCSYFSHCSHCSLCNNGSNGSNCSHCGHCSHCSHCSRKDSKGWWLLYAMHPCKAGVTKKLCTPPLDLNQ